jgi:DNA-binding transcriptional MerR regulator
MTKVSIENISELYTEFENEKNTKSGYGLGALGFPGYINLLQNAEIEKKVKKLEKENKTLKKQIQELQEKDGKKAGSKTKRKSTREKVIDEMDKK